ncbi:MAG: hypothetical protein K6G83_14195 [Lachnospiraceae bacterium]|nr:hypothetical protein [Lachnospiraceae bacterium]
MKYCINCGMLLEDRQDICIGCGADVSDPDNTSQFPPEVAEKMEIMKEQDKKKNSTIVAIVIVFILLAVLIGVIAVVAIKNAPAEEPVTEESAEELPERGSARDEREAETRREEEEAAEAEEERPEPPKNRTVSDDLGSYYMVGEAYDDAGCLMFTTFYPEEFGEPEVKFDYSRYSDQFPAVMSCVIADPNNTMRLTYMSPEHFWYQKSDASGKEYSNATDAATYMTFLGYNGPQNYLDALIKQAYSGAKKIELVETKEASEGVLAALKQLEEEKTRLLTGDIGDYAQIGEGTTYTQTSAESHADYYKYVISTSSGDVYADFYLVTVAHTFSYHNDLGDEGTVTEWLPLCVISYESGNAEKYEFYQEAFTVFVNNSRLTEDFFRVNEAYGRMIDDAIGSNTEVPLLSEELLQEMEAAFTPSDMLKETDRAICDFLATPDSTLKTFSEGDIRVTGVADTEQAFYSEGKKQVFITPSRTEYPGDEFIDLYTR